MYMHWKSLSCYIEYLLFICLYTCWEKVGQSWEINLIFLKNGVLLVKAASLVLKAEDWGWVKNSCNRVGKVKCQSGERGKGANLPTLTYVYLRHHEPIPVIALHPPLPYLLKQ